MLKYPINETYPALYRDAHGEEATTIHNNGETLRMVVRGVAFAGDEPEAFAIAEDDLPPPEAIATFQFNRSKYLVRPGSTEKYYMELRGYEIEYDVPITIHQHSDYPATLNISLTVGVPDERGFTVGTMLTLTLTYAKQTYRGTAAHGTFEVALDEIRATLPPGAYLKTCFGCAFSDFQQMAGASFGLMICFRDSKADYLKVDYFKTKRFDEPELFSLLKKRTEWVQETYCCPEWTRRVPGTGYRG